MNKSHIIAIDFGTSNSYFSKCPIDQISPQEIDVQAKGQSGLPTAILYRGKEKPLIGDQAIEEYVDATEKERCNYELRTQFKPDIADSIEAEKYARDFLAIAMEEAKNNGNIDPASHKIIFGVPSEAQSKFKKKLAELAKASGYGNIEMIDEPIGALLYHLYNKEVTPVEAQKGVLIIDFGGGTCDFTVMSRLKIEHSWGDMELGGRLFDDLFFQWFLEQNPDALNKIRENGDEFYVLYVKCKEIKESFSRRIAHDPKHIGNKIVEASGNFYGRLENMTWEKFLARAQNYTPSKTHLKYLEDSGIKSTKIQPNARINLLKWFEESLLKGLADKRIEPSNIKLTILAGGSSLWPFVPEITQRILMLDTGKIKRSGRPFAVISEGISLLPAMQNDIKKTKKCMDENLPDLLKNVQKNIREKTDEVIRQIHQEIRLQLFKNKILPIIDSFRKNGGSIESLEQQIAREAKAFEPTLHTILNEQLPTLQQGLPSIIYDNISQWFSQYGIYIGEEQLITRIKQHFEVSDNRTKLQYSEDLLDDVAYSIKAISVVITGVIVGSICGGGGMALIASGPFGWIIGALLGAKMGYKMTENLKSWSMPAFVFDMAISDSKIDESAEKLLEDFRKQLDPQFKKWYSGVQDQLENFAKKQIDALDEISMIRPV